MARRGRPTVEITLSAEERATLDRWARRHNSSQALALRCRIVLGCADGLTHAEIADRLGCNPSTVGKWRRRFAEDRLDGLVDAPRPGAARTIGEALNAAQYAQAVQARDVTITAYRGSTLLSDGSLAREIPIIAQLRAQELARTLKKLGLPAASTLTVHWTDQLEAADGVTDPDRRRAQIVVTP